MRALMRALTPTSFDDVAALHRALPAGADERQHALRLRRPQERPQAGRVLPRRRRGGARRHVRPDDLPGERDAGRPEVRRLLARRGRQPAQGDGQEVREVMATAREAFEHGCVATGYGATLGKQLFDIIERVRRLRVQQEPRVRLRARHLPDRLPQGALPGRVLRLPADERQEQPGQGRGVHRRVPGDGHQGARRPTSTARSPTSRAIDAERRAGRRRRCPSAARGRSRSGCRRCATSARGSSPCCSPSATPTGRSPASTTSPSGCPSRCSTSAPSSR